MRTISVVSKYYLYSLTTEKAKHCKPGIFCFQIRHLHALFSVLASQGVIPPLIELLESELEDVLVNAVNAIRVLCEGNAENQTEVARNG